MTAHMGKVAVDGGKQAAAAMRNAWRAPSRSCAPDPYLTLLTLSPKARSPASARRSIEAPAALGAEGGAGGNRSPSGFSVTPHQDRRIYQSERDGVCSILTTPSEAASVSLGILLARMPAIREDRSLRTTSLDLRLIASRMSFTVGTDQLNQIPFTFAMPDQVDIF